MGWLHGSETGRGGEHLCPHGISVREFCPDCAAEKAARAEQQRAAYQAEQEEARRVWAARPLAVETPEITEVAEITDFDRGLTRWVSIRDYVSRYPGEYRYNAARKEMATFSGYPLDVR